jgi:hypothetical protein
MYCMSYLSYSKYMHLHHFNAMLLVIVVLFIISFLITSLTHSLILGIINLHCKVKRLLTLDFCHLVSLLQNALTILLLLSLQDLLFLYQIFVFPSRIASIDS